MTSQIEESHAAGVRGQLYLFLGAIFLKEPELDMIHFLRSSKNLEILNSVGCSLEFPEGKEIDSILEELQVEYTRLFLGPGKHLSPYASVWCDSESKLWSETTIQVQQLIQELGLEYSEEWSGLPDHMGILLELMGKLATCESTAWSENNEEKVNFFQECEKLVLNNFLGWLPDFCGKVEQQSLLDFYRTLSVFLKEFIQEEQFHLERIASS